MNVYTCKDHVGHWLVGTASVIVAETELRAYELLRAELIERGLKHYVEESERMGGQAMPTLQLLDITRAHAVVLRDGDY